MGSRRSGAALIVAAAVGGHREALYSLAVIQFNSSGGHLQLFFAARIETREDTSAAAVGTAQK
ncbi:F-box protein [Panicum miliaceum]|uniref:F-box protein n=1 Tax=Panicum miliaceum TaxID=4540 RepID=A0A3L6SZU6_PANMI|nr:F-box protein [Panicum miliaceum]